MKNNKNMINHALDGEREKSSSDMVYLLNSEWNGY